jgi:Protein of Unknown function (DUF2784)
MSDRLAADLVLLVHALFILWVVFGGLAVWWRAWVAALHLPAALWGVWIEWSGRICPLTPLENRLRLAAGQQGIEGSFIEHYLWGLIYPEGLTREVQWLLGAGVIAVNLLVYGGWLRRRFFSGSSPQSHPR